MGNATPDCPKAYEARAKGNEATVQAWMGSPGQPHQHTYLAEGSSETGKGHRARRESHKLLGGREGTGSIQYQTQPKGSTSMPKHREPVPSPSPLPWGATIPSSPCQKAGVDEASPGELGRSSHTSLPPSPPVGKTDQRPAQRQTIWDNPSRGLQKMRPPFPIQQGWRILAHRTRRHKYIVFI